MVRLEGALELEPKSEVEKRKKETRQESRVDSTIQ